jgi:hypothetical protein
VDLAAEAAAYGRELASDPGFRAQKAEAFAAAVVAAEGVLSDVELKTVSAEHDLNEVRAAASAAERTAASIATAEIERSLEFRASADDAMRRHREVSKLADEAEAEAQTLEKFDDPCRHAPRSRPARPRGTFARGVATRVRRRRRRTTRRGVRGIEDEIGQRARGASIRRERRGVGAG